MTTSLKVIPEPYRSKLTRLGIQTVEDALYVAQASPKALSIYLGTPSVEFMLQFTPTIDARFAAEIQELLKMPLPVDPLQPPPSVVGSDTLTDFAVPEVPLGTVNRISEMPPPRSQGLRNTCVAFAGLSAYEHFLGLAGSRVLLSEQFLYYACKQTDGHASLPGTRLVIAYLVLKNYGCCPLDDWAYSGTNIPNDEGQGPPPDAANADAAIYRMASPRQLPVRTAQSNDIFRSFVYAGRCVAFGLPVFPSSIQNGQARLVGAFVNPVPGEVPAGNHALCVVGYADIPDRPDIGGGYFIVRNSWWPAWATQSPFAPGYGSIPYSYVSAWANEAVAVDLP